MKVSVWGLWQPPITWILLLEWFLKIAPVCFGQKIKTQSRNYIKSLINIWALHVFINKLLNVVIDPVIKGRDAGKYWGFLVFDAALRSKANNAVHLPVRLRSCCCTCKRTTRVTLKWARKRYYQRLTVQEGRCISEILTATINHLCNNEFMKVALNQMNMFSWGRKIFMLCFWGFFLSSVAIWKSSSLYGRVFNSFLLPWWQTNNAHVFLCPIIRNQAAICHQGWLVRNKKGIWGYYITDSLIKRGNYTYKMKGEKDLERNASLSS